MFNKKYIRVMNVSLASMAIAFGVMVSRLGLKSSFANGPNQTFCDNPIDMRQNCEPAINRPDSTFVSTYLGGPYPMCAETGAFANRLCCQYSAQTKFCQFNGFDDYGKPETYTLRSGYLATLQKTEAQLQCVNGNCSY